MSNPEERQAAKAQDAIADQWAADDAAAELRATAQAQIALWTDRLERLDALEAQTGALYIIERFTGDGTNVTFWMKALGDPWTSDITKAEPSDLEEAETFRDMLQDHADHRGTGYLFNIVEIAKEAST